jgi:hypothetical protein
VLRDSVRSLTAYTDGVVQIALTPAESILFEDEWSAVQADLVQHGHDAAFTGEVARRSPDMMDIEVAAAVTLDAGMPAADLAEALRLHLRRSVAGRPRLVAIYGPTGLLERTVDVHGTPVTA